MRLQHSKDPAVDRRRSTKGETIAAIDG